MGDRFFACSKICSSEDHKVRVCNEADGSTDCGGCRERTHKTDQSSNALRRYSVNVFTSFRDFADDFSAQSLVFMLFSGYWMVQLVVMTFEDLVPVVSGVLASL